MASPLLREMSAQAESAAPMGRAEMSCKRITNATGMEFVLIPAGSFMMGSPQNEPGRFGNETRHQVTLSRPFYMQITPATQRQWQMVMGNNPSCFKGDENLPVEQVSWHDIQQFIQRVNEMENTTQYRLPTEAEWEYACRAGSETAYSFGDDTRCLGEYAWYYDNAGGQTQPVGRKKPNAWGLYDMHGNVWEWLQDFDDGEHQDYSSDSVTDPVGPAEGSERVLRGGSWRDYARFCRAAYRNGSNHGKRFDLLGFRLLRAA